MLYYVPLECYPERYTMQWSAPVTGWLERNWIKYNIPYIRIDSSENKTGNKTVQTGFVLDALRRSRHAFQQVENLICLANEGVLTSKDIIFFDDFWHPGIEMLPYTFHLLNIKPTMYAFCHAQSVDEFDFTYPMKNWMRWFEIGIGEILSGVFVNSDILKELLLEGGISSINKIHVIGHIFSEEEVLERMPRYKMTRTTDVIFASRWDSEKNPLFFLNIVENMVKIRPDIRFVVCTSSPTIRSNNPDNIIALRYYLEKFPANLILKEGLTKEQYYHELCKSKIQINTANQDFISIALLEASVAGCFPLYPKFRSFPQAFGYNDMFMYEHLNITSVCQAIDTILSKEYWSDSQIISRSWIHKKHNNSWGRMLNIMFGEKVIEVPAYV